MSERGKIPFITLLLISLNIGMAFFVFLQPELIDQFGFFSDKPSVISSVACVFLHQNVIHLLANMVFLAAVGPAVEFATGTVRFGLIFVSGGIIGVLVHWLATMHHVAPAPLIGASGAISACAAYYSIRYAHLRVPIAPNVSIPILGIVGSWVALQAIGAVIRIGDPLGGVAFWAHLGGFGSGILLSLAFRAPLISKLQFGHEVLDKMNQRSPAATIAAANRHLEEHPEDVKALRNLASAYEQMGDHTSEFNVITKLADSKHQSSNMFALSRLGEMGRLHTISASKRLRAAHELEATDSALAEKILLSIIEERDDLNQKPDAILALLDLRARPDDELGSILLTKYPLHPATELARARGWLA